MANKFVGKAIQIAFIKDNKFCFESRAFRTILEKVGKRHVSVVSVNGPVRTGKSYILGHFLRYVVRTIFCLEEQTRSSSSINGHSGMFS